jgi:hypothetical protein
MITRLAQFAHQSQQRLAAIHLLLLALVIVLTAGIFLSHDADTFPMDDSYIHQVYARHLAEEGKLFFNFPDEPGVGTTSLIWVLLLAGGLKLGLPGTLLAKFLGGLSLYIVGLAVYQLTHPITGRRIGLLAALLVVLSGNMLWFSYSGMETTSFMAAGLMALLAYRQRRWILLGLLLGFMPLIRPEGIVLCAALVQIELLRRRKLDRPMAVIITLSLLLSLPWFIYLIVRTGQPIPTSGIGKQATTDLAIDYVLRRFPQLGFLKLFTPPIYVLSWIAYLLMFALGGMSLPGPVFSLSSLAGSLAYQYAWLALLLMAVTVLPLLWPSLHRLVKPSKWKNWFADDNRRPFLILLVWIILHNLVFSFMLPIPGTASRYGAINHVALWWALALGVYFWQSRGRSLRLFWLAALALLSISNVTYWDRVYSANQEHMQRVRIQAARYVDSQLGFSNCAVFDIGALRSFSSIGVIDIGGLIDPHLQDYYQAGQLDRYLVERGADCIIVPGRTGAPEEGWLDILAVSGLSSSELFELSVANVFEIEHDVWLLGYLPTNNYQASVVIYQMIPPDS